MNRTVRHTRKIFRSSSSLYYNEPIVKSLVYGVYQHNKRCCHAELLTQVVKDEHEIQCAFHLSGVKGKEFSNLERLHR